MKVTISCCLCSNKHEQTFDMPSGWEHRYDGIDDESAGFCPDHAKVSAFAESQCPGCVGGWGDCPMWEAFSSSYRRDIGPDDYKAIECGICPRRVNGTIGFNRGIIEKIDLSERAPVESGKAFADAIKAYCAKYPARAA